MKHGDTRPCSMCGAELWWNADRNVWEGKHAEECRVPRTMMNKAMPSRVRTAADDERAAIGANGVTLWHVTMQMGSPGAAFEEVIGVRAATEDGALLLAQESRLNIAGLRAVKA